MNASLNEHTLQESKAPPSPPSTPCRQQRTRAATTGNVHTFSTYNVLSLINYSQAVVAITVAAEAGGLGNGQLDTRVRCPGTSTKDKPKIR